MRVGFQEIECLKRYPLAISRGVSTRSVNLFVTVEAEGVVGLGEMSPGRLTGAATTAEGRRMLEDLLAGGIEGLSIAEVWQRGGDLGVAPCALAALDVALWDHLAKTAGLPLYRLLGLARRAAPTSITIGIETPEIIRERVPEMLARTGAKFLKIKLGAPAGLELDRANYTAAREAAGAFGVGLRVDANGGWDLPEARSMMDWLASRGCEYVEQPLGEGACEEMRALFPDRPLPIYVDESCRFAADVPPLADRADGVNVKLMKCGGLTEALRIVAAARACKLGTMIGCMSETSVAISAAASIGALFDHIDLDSHLNLAPDPAEGAELDDGVVLPGGGPGHGARLKEGT